MEKRQRQSKTITKIQTISNKRKDINANRVLLLGQVTEKKVNAYPLYFLITLLVNTFCTHFILSDTQANPTQNQKSHLFATA